MKKAEQHSQTEHYKAVKCHKGEDEKDPLKYYNIAENTPISCMHIMSIMVYCNQDLLQRKFSETYRLKKGNESIDSLKDRHSNYAHFGRLLRESIDCFTMEEESKQPFYHGISVESHFESIQAFFNGPLSTSTDYSVAVNFTGNVGMVLELREPFGHSKFWECMYLSDYANEQEALFIGGRQPHLIKSITTPNGTNYGLYIKALSLITFGGFLELEQQEYLTPTLKTMNQLLFRILLHELHGYYPNNDQYKQFKSMPVYIQNLAHRYFGCIDNLWLWLRDEKFINRVFESLFFYDYGWLKLDLLTTIFPNLQRIILYDIYNYGKLYQCRSMYSSILSYLQDKPDTKLQILCIKISCSASRISQRLLVAKEIAQLFRPKFSQFDWTLYVDVDEELSDHLKELTIKVSSVYTDENMTKIRQYYQKTNMLPSTFRIVKYK